MPMPMPAMNEPLVEFKMMRSIDNDSGEAMPTFRQARAENQSKHSSR